MSLLITLTLTVWVMVQIDNGLVIFDDWLVSIKQQDRSFSRIEKKFQITAYTWRAFQLIDAVISSASGQIATFWREILCQHQFELLTWRLLRNVGYNYNLTQNQNVFQPTAKDLLCISCANIKLSTESIL